MSEDPSTQRHAAGSPRSDSPTELAARVTLCGRVLVGRGSDSYDPTCVLPKHHRGQPCVPGDDLRLWIAALATHWRWNSYILPEHGHPGYEVRNRHTVVVRHRKTIKSAVRMARYVAALHGEARK